VKQIFLAAALLASSIGAAHASIAFQAAHLVGVDTNGSYNFSGIWATEPCCASLAVSEGATYGTSSPFSFPNTLLNGTLHLYFTGYNFGTPRLAANLFFDGSNVAGGAAQITIMTDGSSTISGTGTQIGYGNSTLNPNGTLTYSVGGETVTASNFQVLDQANAIIAFDLTTTGGDATGAPEPGSFVLLGGALVAISVRARRRRSQS
jgi:hypothetical protein